MASPAANTISAKVNVGPGGGRWEFRIRANHANGASWWSSPAVLTLPGRIVMVDDADTTGVERSGT
jgi:hypothetical protein